MKPAVLGFLSNWQRSAAKVGRGISSEKPGSSPFCSADGLQRTPLCRLWLGVFEALAVLVQEVHGVRDLAEQVVGHAHGQIILHDNPEHRLLRRLVGEEGHDRLLEGVVHGHVVAADIPVPLCDDVLQVDLVVAQCQVGVEHRRHHRQAHLLLALAHRVEDDEDRLAPALDLREAVAEALGHAHLVRDLVGVAAAAEPQQLVELHVHALRGAGEVQRVGVRAASEVGDVDGHAVGEPLPLAPDDPAGATAGVPELVAARGNGEDVAEAEVPGREPLLERGHEPPGRCVDVDTHAEALLAVQLREGLVDIPDGVVLSAVVVAHDADHADRLLVNHVLQLSGVDRECPPARRDEARLNVHVLEELLPGRLKHRGDDKVRVHAPDLVLVQAVLLPIPLAPAELHRETRQ
mmetsp:Transcript_90748/g.282705  ORF Transcript_90748/g.282705 Transcript_90748/m.282705 type:complete len:406 (+) Transcript_90748:103-1320(+)